MAGDDFLSGLDGDDILFGHEGKDILGGGLGNDILNGGTGDDTVNGGKGVDFVSYYGATGPVVANLTTGTATGEGTDSLINIENIFGGSGNDSLTGNTNVNYLDGWAGDDFLSGLDGDDTLFGNDGKDTLNGGSGNDTLSGDLDQDTLIGGSGSDLFLLGQNGAQTDVAFADLITDFQVGIDTIGLSGGLTAANLRLEIVNDRNTVIRVADSGQILAVVNSVNPDQLLGSFVNANISLI